MWFCNSEILGFISNNGAKRQMSLHFFFAARRAHLNCHVHFGVHFEILSCHSEIHGGQHSWRTWPVKRRWGNRFVQPKRKAQGKPCCCRLEDGTKLFLNANNGDKTRGNEHILGQDEITIISSVKGSRRQSLGQCNLIRPPLSNGFGLDDFQQSLVIGVVLWTSGKIYFLLYQDIILK